MRVGNDDVVSQHSFPDLNPNPVFETSLNGKVVYSNTAARTAFGNFESYSWLRATVDLFAHGKRDDLPLTLKVGPSRWFQFTVFFVQELQLIRFYGMDITPLKLAEEEIQREKDRLQALVSSIPDEVWFADTQKQIFLMNPSTPQGLDLFCSCFNLNNLSSHMEMCHPDGTPLPSDEAAAIRALRGEVVKDHEILRRTPGGNMEFRSKQVSAAPVRNADGGIIGSVAVVRDITDRRKLEQKLVATNESLESLVKDRTGQLEKSVRLYRMLSQCNQALVNASIEVDLMQTICRIVVEEGGYKMSWVGYAEHDAEKTVRSVASFGFDDGYFERARIVWADVERGRGPTGLAIREDRVVVGEDFLSDPKLSPWREAAIQRGYRSSLAIPLKEEHKSPFGALTIYSIIPRAFDQSEIELLKELSADLSFGIQAIRAQAERNDAQKSLELSNRQLHRLSAQLTLAEQNERRQLAGILHDEVQQILVGAKLRLECIEDEAARPCQDLLENCLRITRSLTAELCPSVLYQGNVIAVLDWLTKWSKEKYDLNITLETPVQKLKLPEDLTIMIYRSVQELLFNLAKHAGTRDGKIEIASLGNQVQITVSDSGKGFDPSAVKLHSVDGGFGLFAVQERLVNRGCEFRIQSSPGKGSVFTIAVALKEESKVAALTTRATHSKTKVLIVDDHSVMRQALAAMLDLSKDIEVVGQAENGRAALDCARRLSPDIVLMDIEMPEIDGIKATRLLRLEHPQIKVIGLSMHDKNDMEKDFLNAGASAFLMKNAPSDELIQAIRAVHAL